MGLGAASSRKHWWKFWLNRTFNVKLSSEDPPSWLCLCWQTPDRTGALEEEENTKSTKRWRAVRQKSDVSGRKRRNTWDKSGHDRLRSAGAGVVLTGWQTSLSPSHTWTSQWSQTVDTFSSRWKRNELNLNMERLSLAFSKIVTVLSEEQLLDDKDGFANKTAGSEWTSRWRWPDGGRTRWNRHWAGCPTVTVSWFGPAARLRSPTSCPRFRFYLLMMRLHLFLSVEYGVGVAQQWFITTLNLWGARWNKKEGSDMQGRSTESDLWTVLRYLLLSPFASMPMKTSEPISDVSITYGASLAYRNLEFYKIHHLIWDFVMWPVFDALITCKMSMKAWKDLRRRNWVCEQRLTVNTFIDNCDLKVPKLPLLT